MSEIEAKKFLQIKSDKYSRNDVIKAYRKLAKHYHPDKHVGDDNEIYTNLFMSLQEAKETLIKVVPSQGFRSTQSAYSRQSSYSSQDTSYQSQNSTHSEYDEAYFYAFANAFYARENGAGGARDEANGKSFDPYEFLRKREQRRESKTGLVLAVIGMIFSFIAENLMSIITWIVGTIILIVLMYFGFHYIWHFLTSIF